MVPTYIGYYCTQGFMEGFCEPIFIHDNLFYKQIIKDDILIGYEQLQIQGLFFQDTIMKTNKNPLYVYSTGCELFKGNKEEISKHLENYLSKNIVLDDFKIDIYSFLGQKEKAEKLMKNMDIYYFSPQEKIVQKQMVLKFFN